MLKRFYKWILNLLGVGEVEHFDVEPVQSVPAWKVRDARTLSSMECANKCGRAFDVPSGFPSEGYFWKRDRGAIGRVGGARKYRLYRVSV